MNKPATSKQLNETMAKKFGTKIDVESFTLEQLQDARNKIRSKVFDIETNESFGGLPNNKTYSKNKLFLDVLNAAISERADIQEGEVPAGLKAYQDKKKGKNPADTDDADKKPEDDEKVDEGKPDFLDMDKDGDKKEPMKKAIKDKKKKVKEEKGKLTKAQASKYTCEDCGCQMHNCKPDCDCKHDSHDESGSWWKDKNGNGVPDIMETKHMDEGKNIINNYFTSILKEGEEDKAELVMASKDMVDRLTGWMEDTAEMQTESMLELADAIRDEMGAQQSEAFTNAVKPALEQLYASMETTRVALTTGVGMLTGEGEAPAMDMGDEEPAMDAMDEPDMEPTDDMDMETDGFDAAAPAAGGEDEAGRAKRESRMQKKKMIETSRRLGSILSKPSK